MLTINEAALGRRFFKFLLPHFSTKLSIPLGFIVDEETSENDGEETASLVNPIGKIWNVSLFAEEDTLYFGGEGWRHLAIAHGMRVGELLVFQYKGNNAFRFRIFESSSTFERSPFSAFPSPPQIQWKEESPAEVLGQSAKDSGKTRSSADCSKSKGYFEVVIQPSHTKLCCTHIPVKFRESSGLTEEDKHMSIRDPEGRIWHVSLFGRKNVNGAVFCITKGWIAFARANDLKVGDRCIFELVEEGQTKVYRFKREK